MWLFGWEIFCLVSGIWGYVIKTFGRVVLLKKDYDWELVSRAYTLA